MLKTPRGLSLNHDWFACQLQRAEFLRKGSHDGPLFQMFSLSLQSIISNHMRPWRLKGAWFSRLLRHPARRRRGSMLYRVRRDSAVNRFYCNLYSHNMCIGSITCDGFTRSKQQRRRATEGTSSGQFFMSQPHHNPLNYGNALSSDHAG